jgi:RNA polymerase sigma-70 factor (ECF subfamily)
VLIGFAFFEELAFAPGRSRHNEETDAQPGRIRDLLCDLDSDAALLDRFARLRDEAAFGRLVERHGPAVLRACRRVLRCEHDVEDVFQATFLVLAGKAGKVAWGFSVRAWLHSVATRLALHAKARSGLRKIRERSLGTVLTEADRPNADPHQEIERGELRRVLDEALRQLPEKYRAPVVLCYLEGKTNDEAARELGWPAGSMSRRLERARYLLRHRLARTGFVLLALVGAAVMVSRPAPELASLPTASVPAPRAGQGVRAGVHDDIDADAILQRLVRGDGVLPGREQIDALARNSVRAAEQMREHEARENAGTWRLQTKSMEEAAVSLGRAARMGDRLAMLGSARRLDAACVRCHEVSRAGIGVSGPPSATWIE